MEEQELAQVGGERRRAVPVEVFVTVAAESNLGIREARATSHVKQVMGLVERARLLDWVKGVW